MTTNPKENRRKKLLERYTYTYRSRARVSSERGGRREDEMRITYQMMMTKTKTTVIIANHVTRNREDRKQKKQQKLTMSWLQLKKRSNKRRIRKRLSN